MSRWLILWNEFRARDSFAVQRAVLVDRQKKLMSDDCFYDEQMSQAQENYDLSFCFFCIKAKEADWFLAGQEQAIPAFSKETPTT